MKSQQEGHSAGGHSHGLGRDAKPLWIAFGLIGTFLVVEVAGALVTGSLALLADAGHMLSDVAALALALFAFWIATRPATPERTYGYYRVEVLAALGNAVTLVLISLYIFWEAFQRLSAPPEVHSLPMIAVATAGLIANIGAAFALHRGAGESINVRGAFLHVIGDLLGSVGAILAGLVMLTTGWYYADPLISVLIGILVLYSGWRLLRETVDILLEATPSSVDTSRIQATLLEIPGVDGVHDLHVWTVTSGFLAMSVHIQTKTDEQARILEEATVLLRRRFGIDHTTIQIERPGRTSEGGQACEGPGCVGPRGRSQRSPR